MNADSLKQREGGFLIAKIHQITNRIFKRMLKDYGIADLNPGQGRILFALWQNDDIPIRELAIKTQLTKSTLTTMLDRLETAGYLNQRKRYSDKNDRRIIKIKLSDKSEGLKEKYGIVSKKMTEIFYRTLNENEVDEFEDYLRRILDNLVSSI